MEENKPKEQAQVPVQQQQAGEQTGMSKSFSENSSIELLNNRRIDQIVAKRESERNAIAEGMANAENRGMETGKQVGKEEGFMAGHNYGLEDGFHNGRRYAESKFGKDSGLGSSLGSLTNTTQDSNV